MNISRLDYINLTEVSKADINQALDAIGVTPVVRVTNKDLVAKYNDTDVHVIKDTPEGYLAGVNASVYTGRGTKKQAQVDKLQALGLTSQQIIDILG